MSLSTSTVPRQWKEARIKPIPKVTASVQHSDFRPISVTPVQTRMIERAVVREFLYPSFLTPPPSFAFLDQYAFRPTSSTSAAVMSLLHTISTLIQSNPFVTVISLDFSKAFDTVRHSTLMAKMTEVELPVPVYNWPVDFFREHAHRTVFNGEESSTASISASIVQGSVSVHRHSRRSENIAIRQFASEIRKRHVSCRSISQRQHAPAGDGQHCNMGCSE